MPERILPGVTVTVKTEGLITTQAGATNVIGVIGTASSGPIGEVTTCSTFSEAQSLYQFDATSLTLMKALGLAYNNGATTVRACRIATGSAAYATKNLLNGATPEITLTAIYKGTYGNTISVVVTVNGSNRDMVLTDGTIVETYVNVATNADFVTAINAQSNLVTATLLASTLIDASSASNLTTGNDGEGVSNSDYITGLTALEAVDINFVLCAGQSDNSLHSSMNAHCQNMANQNKERIAIAGCALAESIATIMARTVKSDRFVFVCPGVKTIDLVTGDDVTLSGAYTAAAIAGMLAARDVQASATNQVLGGVSDLEEAYTDSELKQLLLDNRSPIKIKNGIRFARAITSSTNSAWQQLTTRRIVDYVKAGVRNAGDQFIGSLNNERVRSSLKGVIDAFCNDLVDNEVLIGYKSEVTATRADEIAGVCKVTLQIQPVFSIDFIEVTIYLS